MTSQTLQPADGWADCRGEVRGLVSRLRWRRRLRYAKRDAAMLVLTLAFMFGAYSNADRIQAMQFQANGCMCERYQQQLTQYYCDRTASELDPRLWEHLSKCADCRSDLVLQSKLAPKLASKATRQPAEAPKRTDNTKPVRAISGQDLRAGLILGSAG